MILAPEAVQRLERATLDAVAPRRVQTLGNWLLAFDPSTISRTKSAVPLRHQGLGGGDIAAIAQRYRDQGLPPLLRVADMPTLQQVHAAMRAQGLAPTQPTLVQVAQLADVLSLHTVHDAAVETHPSDAWASVYTAPGFDAVDGAYRRAALSRSPFVVYAHVQQDGQTLAAGTASLSQGWASIHGMRTVPTARGRGLAGAILAALARHALAQGLSAVFLQVEENNMQAQSLYRRAGFGTAWRYHHWR